MIRDILSFLTLFCGLMLNHTLLIFFILLQCQLLLYRLKPKYLCHARTKDQKQFFQPPYTSNTFSDDQINLSKDGSVQLSFATSLPPNSSLYITLDYSPRFLPFDHFPSDPNRGFDVAPSFATFTTGSSSFRVYSNSLLVMPPVPDISMPFNVISLVSSFYALIIGTIMNILIRRGSQKISDAFKGIKQKSPFQQLKDGLEEKFKRITGRQKGDS